jgi:hypothetical protein
MARAFSTLHPFVTMEVIVAHQVRLHQTWLRLRISQGRGEIDRAKKIL